MDKALSNEQSNAAEAFNIKKKVIAFKASKKLKRESVECFITSSLHCFIA
jgi:hypothetical protein